MTRLLIAICLMFTFVSCVKKTTKKNICKSEVLIESTSICLPNYKGFSNILYSTKDERYFKYSEIIENLSNNKQDMLAFYVSDSSNVENYNCFSMYVNKKTKDDITRTQFNYLADGMESFLLSIENRAEVISKLKNNYKINTEIPVVLEKYSINDNLKTYILLSKTIDANGETPTITTLNFIYLRNKILMVNYIIKYENYNSVDVLKQKNDYVLMRLLDENY